MNDMIELFIKVIMGGILAWWLNNDARGRDYSAWILWTMIPITALFAPTLVGTMIYLVLIIIIYLIMRPKGALLPCPRCNKKIHEILTICPFCNKDSKGECLNCHEPVSWDAERCPYCKSKELTSKPQ